MRSNEPTWSGPGEEGWAAIFTLTAAGKPGVRRADIVEWLWLVRDAVNASGRDVESLFGPPDEAALEFTSGLPVERRASQGWDLMSGMSLLQAFTVGAGLPLILFGVVLWVRDGWLVVAGAALLSLLVSLLSAVSAGAVVLLGAGRTRAAIALGAGVVAGIVATASLAPFRAIGGSTKVPVVLLVLLGTVLFVIFWRLPDRDPADEWSTTELSTDEWLTRLSRVLRYRYAMPRGVVAQHVREARAHLQQGGETRPVEEFGAPEVYALTLLDSDERREEYRYRLGRREDAFLWAGFLYFLVDAIADGDTVETILFASVLAVKAAFTLRRVRRSAEPPCDPPPQRT